MREADIERHFVWSVERCGGKTWKFTSPGRRGVADRIACMPNGSTWFVELKTLGGKFSALQLAFAADMVRLNQRYACLSSKEEVDMFILSLGLIRYDS